MTPDSPPAPDASDELVALVALSLASGIGPKLQSALLSQFGTACEVLSQPKDVLLTVNGIGPKTAASIVNQGLLDEARLLLAECHALQIDVLDQKHRDYPQRLREICDSPTVLYQKGVLLPQDELAIGIVGSRRCTAYGRRQAERMAAALSRAGFTIVSGLARGIDAAAHRGALKSGGRTLAIMASGVKTIYPPEHKDLAEEISQQGALLSEMPLDQRPLPGLFPQRNRIISGICLGVIVVEATRNSGALYTARHALEQGREVFALPGPVDSLASEGCHDLIRDGVTLVRNVDDVLSELGPLPMPSMQSATVTIHSPRELALTAQETEVLNHITSQPTGIDEILRACNLESSRVLATLTMLEMRRLIRRQPGNSYVRHD
ncbi:MAG: DNA-protecting protein DprA [Fuerstia sp.]|nr:DNA-protecting protein DprA [Fuerstiella sp.]